MSNDKETKDFFGSFGERLTVLTNGLMNKLSDDINKTGEKISAIKNQTGGTRSSKMFADVDSLVRDNGNVMDQYGLDSDSPPFLLNHVAENLKSESKKNTVTSSTSSVIETEQITPDVGSEEDKTQKIDNKNTKLLDRKKVRELGEQLRNRVFGQDEVIEEVIDVLKISALNIKINKAKPAGCYLFAGPSGVGKTELAQSIAESLGVPFLKIDGGEYGLEQDVTKLIGTAKGYVGYNEGGLLTNFVTENSACVVLLDELEKAHTSIDKILLSIMDHGVCTDNKGRKVLFKETIFISTSNLGAKVEYSTELTKQEKNTIRMESIKQGLRPEIINRYDSIFHFNALSSEIYKLVTNKFLTSLNKSIEEEHEFAVKFSPKLIDFIVEKSYDPAMGGRPARKFIEKVVMKPLTDYMINDDAFLDVAKDAKIITMDLNKSNKICFKAKNKILGVLENTDELVARIEGGKFTDKPASPRRKL